MAEAGHATAGEERPRRPPSIPFLTTSFSQDLALLVYLWPAWWILGVEQFLVPFFACWETLRSLVRRRGRLPLNSTVGWAFALACWWLVPIGWVEPDQLTLFLKESATIWSQVMFLYLFAAEVRCPEDWRTVMRGLAALGAYVAIAGTVYVFGLWRGEVTSFAGRLLSPELAEGSEFFSSIAFRSLGDGDLFRLKSLALAYSSLSLVCLLLIPLLAWRVSRSTGLLRLWHALMLVGLVVALAGAQSRLAYLALVVGGACGLLLLVWRRTDWRLRLAVCVVLGSILVGSVWSMYEDLIGDTAIWLTETRPESLEVRLIVWEETLRLLGEHPVAGWGAPVQIAGMRTVFSAGTHSSVLAILFQHGAVGVLLYLALWVSLWRRVVRGLGRPPAGFLFGFWPMAAVAMICFNLRELADNWWWDQIVTVTLWSLWGMVLAAERMGRNRPTAGRAPWREAGGP